MAKILVVDDEPDMIWAITNVLLSENHAVVSVNSGEEALKKVQDQTVDLVLLDFRLPGMDGIQILEQIKTIKPDLPVIMVTGYGGIEEAVQAIKLGAAHYIAKPFDNDNLIETVNKALQLDSLKKEGVFGKRLAEKIGPRGAEKPARGAAAPPEVKPGSARGGKGKALAIAAAGLILAGGAALYWFSVKNRDQEFLIPDSKISGLSWGGGFLWASDWFTQSVYQYQVKDADLRLVNNFVLPGYHITGIAWADGSLYTCDSWKKMIFKHALDPTLSVVGKAASPGPNPSGLYFDGKYLWSCDGTSRKIYQHAADDRLTVLAAYDSPGLFPVGLYHDNRDFWSASAEGMKIFTNSLQERFKLEKTCVFPDSFDIARQISAFTLEKGRIWIAYEGVNKIYEKDPSRLKEVAP